MFIRESYLNKAGEKRQKEKNYDLYLHHKNTEKKSILKAEYLEGRK